MEYSEEEFLMLSGIQHYAFCRRQWALIHIEQQWDENVRTAGGEIMHNRAHNPDLSESSNGVRIVRSLPVHSCELGLSGQCDVVEFRQCDEGIHLFGHNGLFSVYPIEYKRGKPKDTDIDKLQLVAQVMCLEEMLSTVIGEGCLYYGETRRREKVDITEELRARVRELSGEMHELYKSGATPKAKWQKGCNACSMKEICMPEINRTTSVREYIAERVESESL